MPLQPVARQSVTDAVFDQLLEGVLSGELDAGDPLPAERALTQALGVNRQAVREALQRLSASGLVEIRHGGRTIVSDFRHSAGLELLPRLLLDGDGNVDHRAAMSIMELRSCLGPDIARRCAQRASAEQTERIRKVVDDMAAEPELDRLVPMDLALWDAFVDASDNIAYRLAFNTLRRTYEPIALLLCEALTAELRDAAGRQVIASAVAAGDGEAAAAAAQRLLQRGEDGVRRLLEQMEAAS